MIWLQRFYAHVLPRGREMLRAAQARYEPRQPARREAMRARRAARREVRHRAACARRMRAEAKPPATQARSSARVRYACVRQRHSAARTCACGSAAQPMAAFVVYNSTTRAIHGVHVCRFADSRAPSRPFAPRFRPASSRSGGPPARPLSIRCHCIDVAFSWLSFATADR